MNQHTVPSSMAGFRIRWKKLQGALAPIRSTLCLSGTGFWSSFSHSTISWHSGIHWPGSNWSASFLEIWVRVYTHNVNTQSNGMVDSSCLTHSGEREWCYSPALLCHEPICWNVQSDFAAPKSNPQGGLLLGKVAIVLSHNLHWKFSIDYSRKCM